MCSLIADFVFLKNEPSVGKIVLVLISCGADMKGCRNQCYDKHPRAGKPQCKNNWLSKRSVFLMFGNTGTFWENFCHGAISMMTTAGTCPMKDEVSQ